MLGRRDRGGWDAPVPFLLVCHLLHLVVVHLHANRLVRLGVEDGGPHFVRRNVPAMLLGYGSDIGVLARSTWKLVQCAPSALRWILTISG